MTITPEQFLAELRTIAEKAQAELGGKDHVYITPGRASVGSGVADCFYVHYDEEGQPFAGCIIGQWLHELHEVSFTQLATFEGDGAEAPIDAFGLGLYAGLQQPGPVQRIANRIQSKQDQGVGWLAAVGEVERDYEIGLFNE